MHADTLYHRMLDQEAQIEAAKAEGKPVPSFPPLLSQSRSGQAASMQQANPPSSTSGTEQIKPSDLSLAVQEQLKKRLDGLNDEEREIEEKAIVAEINAGEQLAGNLGSIYQKQEEERKQRKQQGRETIGDKVTSLFRGSR